MLLFVPDLFNWPGTNVKSILTFFISLFRHVLGGFGRFLAIFGPILCSELFPQARVANKTLAFGAKVLVTPVFFILESLGDLRAAHAAFAFLDAMLITPPT